MGLIFKKTHPAAETVPDELRELRAEYQNYRRRTALELSAASEEGAKKAVLALLPVYDDLQRALQSPCADAAYRRGVELTLENLLASLRTLGVAPMDSEGKCFNPDYHEAVEHIEDASLGAERVARVLQTGFTMHEMVIRHAKVIVAN